SQVPSTGRQIVVDHVEYFAVNSLLQASQRYRLRTIVDVRERYGIRTTQVQENSECADAHTARYAFVARTVNLSRSDDYVWNSQLTAVLLHDPVLLDLRKTVCFTAQMRAFL